MKVAVDIRPMLSPIRTGVGEYAFSLLDAVFRIDRANEYMLFYNAGKDVSRLLPAWRYDNVRFAGFRWPNKLFNTASCLGGYPKLDRLIGGADVWFSPNLHFTSLSRGVRHVLTIHDLSFEHFPDCYSWKRRVWHRVLFPKKQCERADVILTPSENTKRDVVDTFGVQANKVRCVYPGVAEDMGEPVSEEKKNEVREKYRLPKHFIFFLGTIEPRKNIEGFLEAYEKWKGGDRYGFVIAGPLGWKYRPILGAIRRTRGAQYIGHVDAEDKPALFQLSRVFVYPSLFEGFGFPVLEAFGADVPVMTSNRSSLPEIADSAAYLVNPYSVTDMVRGLERLTCDDEIRKFFIERGRKRASAFRWEHAARAWLKVIV